MRALFCLLTLGLAFGAAGTLAQAQLDDAFTAPIARSTARLNFVDAYSRSSCTAVLFTARTALTAASCIGGTPPAAIHLLFGYDKGTWSDHRRVGEVIKDTGAGLALLCLDADVAGVPVRSDASLPDGADLVVASYRTPRSFALSLDRCTVRLSEPDGILAEGCQGSPGMNGAGVFETADGAAKLSGVVVGHADDVLIVRRWAGEEPDQLCRGV